MGERHTGGHSEQLPFVGGDALGVGTAGLDAHHPVAHLPHRHPCADVDDGAGELEAGDLGLHPPRIGVQPHPLQQIGAVQRRRRHLDEHLVGPRHRIGDIFDGEDLGSTVGVQDDSAHGADSHTGTIGLMCRQRS